MLDFALDDRSHAEPACGVLARLGTAPREGLTEAEAAHRVARYGANAIDLIVPRSRLQVLRGQIDLTSGILLGSSLLAFALGDWIDGATIAIVIGANGLIGYRLERQSEQMLAAWQRLEAGTATVIRDGTLRAIPATDLVPGDLMVFRAGDILPADARVLDAHRVSVDESTLTGESEAVRKDPAPVDPGAALADRRSMLWKGTTVASGHGRAVVTATGAATQVARIRALIEEARAPRAPLQRRLADLGKRVMIVGLGASALSAAAGVVWRKPPLAILRNTVALAVASIPEGLPVTATAALTRSMRRLRAAGMVVRRLSVAETLGGVTVVCADKTGTLTENAMRLERLEPADPRVLVAALLNSDLDYHHNRVGVLELAGSSTEQAIARAAVGAGADPKKLRLAWPRRRLVERRDGIHFVVSIHDAPAGGTLAFMKGAPEQVVPRCGLDEVARAAVLARNHELAATGHRVLAVAWRELAAVADVPDDGWAYLGLVALRDPVRPHARAAVAAAARAGIRTIILTGDQLATAAAIGREVGLTGVAVEGAAAARADLDRVAVVARATPSDKVALIEALRARGEIVAMAGDGVNDAAALKVADVGIAVGAGASDLARQTADVVLQHADLRSILTAIGEGRIVQDNLRRAARYLFATNLGEVLVVVGGALFGREPLTSLQLLWINLLTDTLPALGLALEPGDPAILDRPPAPPGRPLLDRADWRAIGRDGVALGALAGAAGLAGPAGTFAAVGGSQFGYAAASRAPGPGVGRFATLIGAGAAAHLAAMALAPLRSLLRVPAAGPAGLAVFVGSLALPLLVRGWSRSGELAFPGLHPAGDPS